MKILKREKSFDATDINPLVKQLLTKRSNTFKLSTFQVSFYVIFDEEKYFVDEVNELPSELVNAAFAILKMEKNSLGDLDQIDTESELNAYGGNKRNGWSRLEM